jgi:hypothetical protein
MKPMRLTLATTVLVLGATPAFAEPYDRDPLPRNESALSDLNAEQLRIVRRASRLCAQTTALAIKAERNPCVMASTDKAIADTDDPALQAFHAALPDNDRYDEYRTDTTWRAFLVDDPDGDH